jgi:hypothetical protein
LKTRALALTALTLLVASSFLTAVPAASGANITDFVRDINTFWGTPSSPTGAAPGDTNVPLTLTFQYVYPLDASSVQGLLTLPKGFALYDGTNQTYASTSGGVSSSSVFQLTFDGIFLSPDLPLGSYNFTLDLWAYSGSGLILQQNSTVSAYVEGIPQLQFGTPEPSLTAGGVDEVPLVITNDGTGNASHVSLTVSASAVSVLTPSFKFLSLAAGQSAPVEVEVYVPSSVSGSAISVSLAATYDDPYGAQQSASQGVAFYVATAAASPLYYQSGDVSLIPGVINTIPITLTNQGTGPATQVHTQVSSASQVSILTQFPMVPDIAPNSSVTDSIEVYVSSSLASSPLALTFSYSFISPLGITSSSTQSVGLYTTSSNSSLPSVLISVSPVKSNVDVGVQSKVSFDVEDVGHTTLQSPVLSLAVSSPLVVIGNSSYAIPSGVLTPGDPVVYDALVGSSTSASPGFYSSSVTVTYIDQSGTTKSATYSTALVLSGTIDLIIQSPQVTQSNNTLSISGEILNEGFSSAYYASVTGSIVGVRGTSQADYVGEIDPNTPVPFSVTISYAPQSSTRSANVSVDVAFKDSLGIQGAYSSAVQTTLSSSSPVLSSSPTSSGSTSGADLLTYLEIGVIVALVVVGAVGFIYIRRNRASATPPEPDEKPDQGVI